MSRDLPDNIDADRLGRLIRLAREEDFGERGDITAGLLPPRTEAARIAVVARQGGVFAGQPVLPCLLDALCKGEPVEIADCVADGAALSPQQCICTLTGPAAPLLAAERTVLNFLQRLSGVATLTRAYVDAVASTQARIHDTRKTVPGWRDLDKYAVRCGGGRNHRHGLHDAILIKDNHLAGIEPARLAGAVFEMLNTASALAPPARFVEVEVDTLAQLAEVLKVMGVDIVLLDNFSLADLAAAVALRDEHGLRDKVALEASGGVNLEAVRDVAQTGVDRIAVGAITHSAPALDIAFDQIP